MDLNSDKQESEGASSESKQGTSNEPQSTIEASNEIVSEPEPENPVSIPSLIEPTTDSETSLEPEEPSAETVEHILEEVSTVPYENEEIQSPIIIISDDEVIDPYLSTSTQEITPQSLSNQFSIEFHSKFHFDPVFQREELKREENLVKFLRENRTKSLLEIPRSTLASFAEFQTKKILELSQNDPNTSSARLQFLQETKNEFRRIVAHHERQKLNVTPNMLANMAAICEACPNSNEEFEFWSFYCTNVTIPILPIPRYSNGQQPLSNPRNSYYSS